MQLITNMDEQFWWDIAKKCSYATFFHTPIWQNLALRTYPKYKDATVGFILKSGVQGFLPLLEKGNYPGLSRDLISTFAGCYGDVITDGAITDDERHELYHKLIDLNVGRLRIVGNPLTNSKIMYKRMEGYDDHTQLIRLDKDFQQIFSKYSKGHKSSYTRGIRLGVTVRCSSSIEDYEQYYAAYKDALRRWGKTASSYYPWEFFLHGYETAQEYPDNIKLWIAEIGDKFAAGAWVFYWNNHVDWWHGAAYEEFFNYSPNNVLQTHIIQDAIKSNFLYYDFNPSGGHKNVDNFKRRFGTEQRNFSFYVYENKIYRLIGQAKGFFKHEF